MKIFTVVLPIEVAGRIYQHGATVELDEEQAALYSHALRANTAAGAPAEEQTAGAAKNAGEMISGSHI